MLTIAQSSSAMEAAQKKFKSVTYAPGTVVSKGVRSRLWHDFAGALEIDPFPLTPGKVTAFAAALRDAGYRSGAFYLGEIQQVHVRMGFDVDGPLRMAIADARRGLERGLGPPTRAAEIRPEWLDEFQATIDIGDTILDRPGDGPRGGVYAWGVGCGWLLREIELAMLDMHAETVTIDESTGAATIRVGASKTDPAGRGAARTLPCRCGGRRRPSCAACSARTVLELAVAAWPGDRHSEAARRIPLIGTVADAGRTVEKAAFVRAAQADARILGSMDLLHVDPATVTGHFMRRSGAKSLARRGVPLAKIQWLGRWGVRGCPHIR